MRPHFIWSLSDRFLWARVLIKRDYLKMIMSLRLTNISDKISSLLVFKDTVFSCGERSLFDQIKFYLERLSVKTNNKISTIKLFITTKKFRSHLERINKHRVVARAIKGSKWLCRKLIRCSHVGVSHSRAIHLVPPYLQNVVFPLRF